MNLGYPDAVGTPLGASVPALILALLADGTPRSRAQLARALSVSPARVGDALAALHRRGHVALVGYERTGGTNWGRSVAALWARTSAGES